MTVVFSSGEQSFSVPPVDGLPEDQARAKIENAPGGFKVADKNVERDDEKPAGTVLAVSPDPSKKYASGTEFTLTVSSGKVEAEVPQLLNVQADDAAAQLKARGFIVARKYGEDPNAIDGTVIAQSIEGGKKAPKGTTITHHHQPAAGRRPER